MANLNPLLRLAVMTNALTAVKHHIERGDDLNAVDKNGSTPLIIAVIKKNIDIVKLLLASGADPSIIDKNGKDALSYALEGDFKELVEILKTPK